MYLTERIKQSFKKISNTIKNSMQPACNLDCRYKGCNCCSKCKQNRKYKDYYTPIKYK